MWQGMGHVGDILREFLGHNFVSGLGTLKPKNLTTFCFKKLVFPALGTDYANNTHRTYYRQSPRGYNEHLFIYIYSI